MISSASPPWSRRGLRGMSVLALVGLFALLLSPAVRADNIVNDIAVTGANTFTAPGSATVGYKVVATGGDGQTGCNAADATPLTLTISVPAAVTASTASLTFTTCNAFQSVTFSSSTPGDYAINDTPHDTGPGTYNDNADFTLHVLAPANTPPNLSLPSNLAAEATGPSGAAVTYSATASDAEDGALAPSCSPTSGSTFPLGTTTVSCTVTDSGGLTTTGSFTVTVQDTTAPSLSLPATITEEATSSSGATVSYTATASDLVDGSITPSCSPASGSTFPLGSTPVNCSATDAHSNTASGSFQVIVQDTTAPVLSLPSNITAEATGPTGAAVSYSASASDLVDGPVSVNCAPASGTTFPLGTTPVSCSATDTAGNPASGSFAVTVVDTTPPALTLPSNITAEATGPSGAAVSYSASATDLVDGSVAVGCSPASGSTFALGTTTVNCSATDAHGNTATGSFTVTVRDTTAPSLSLPANQVVDPTSAAGAVVTYTASASDLVDGAVSVNCSPASGSTFGFGTTTVTCTATDAHGNPATGSFTVTVKPLTISGFYQPVDNLPTLNTVKNGSTVPIKFEVFAGSTELTSTSGIAFSAKQINCDTTAPIDDIEVVSTGGTSLRYDATSGQFIQNWQTPKTVGKCYAVTLTAPDGSSKTADFKLK